MSKLKRLLCYESQHQSQSNEKSLIQFDYEKAVSNYLGTQSTFNPRARMYVCMYVYMPALHHVARDFLVFVYMRTCMHVCMFVYLPALHDVTTPFSSVSVTLVCACASVRALFLLFP